MWQSTGQIPSYYELQRVFKDDFWCRQVHSHTAQAVLHKLSEAYRSWFTLRKTDVSANPPMFRRKGSVSTVTFTKFAVRVNGFSMRLSLRSKQFVHVPFQLRPSTVVNQGNFVRVEIKGDVANVVFWVDEPSFKGAGQVMGVDLGVVNSAVTVKEDGEASVYSGKQLLSVQRYFNKETGRVQGIVMAQSNGKKTWSRKLSWLARKRRR